MSETLATETQATETNQPATTSADAENAFSLNDLERAYFGPDNLAAANDLHEKILTVLDEKDVHYNIDLANEAMPDGYGIYVVPVYKRLDKADEDGNKTEIVGVCFYAAPAFETVLADEKGREYVKDALFAAFSQKMANSIRPTRDGVLGKKPFALADFIERKTRGDSFKAFNDLSKELVETLRRMGLRSINRAILRQCLSNTAIAESQYPAMKQEIWQAILDMCIAEATKAKLDPAIFENWKATRDNASAHDETIDMDALEAAFG